MSRYILLLVCAAFFALVSCESAQENTGEGIRLLVAEDCAKKLVSGDTVADLQSLGLALLNIRVFETATKANLKIYTYKVSDGKITEKMTMDGIKDMTDATIEIRAFKADDFNSENWRGSVSGVSFKSGKTTSVDVVLYPVKDTACFPKALETPRFGHTATTLPDGRILVAGGFAESSDGKTWAATDSVELIDPESGTVETIASMTENRAMHLAILLPDGRVVFVGGSRELKTDALKVESFPDMPFTLSKPAKSIEVYTVGVMKPNQVKNGAVGIAENKSEVIANPEFLPYQSYGFVKKDDKGNGVIFAAGGLKDGKAVNNLYAGDLLISEEDSSVSAEINEILASKTERDLLLLPVIAALSDSEVIIAGGRGTGAQAKANIISKSKITKITSTDNFIAGSAISTGTTAYTLGGFGYSAKPKISRFTSEEAVSEDFKIVSGSDEVPLDSIYDDLLYFEEKDQAGTVTSKNIVAFDGKILMKLDAETLTMGDFWLQLDTPRLMPRLALTRNNYVMIIGGVGAFANAGSLEAQIEIREASNIF